MLYKNIGYYLICFIIIIICNYNKSFTTEIPGDEAKTYIWRQVNGVWEIQKDNKNTFISEKKSKSYQWGYNELINHNTLITIDPLKSYNRIFYHVKFVDPLTDNVRYMSSFGIVEDRIFYAFRLMGDGNRIKKIDFIGSTVKDPEKDKKVKWNFDIKTLASIEYSLQYNTEYMFEIRIDAKKVTLLLNNKSVMSINQQIDKVAGGRFGFSSLNMKPMIWDISVFDGRKKVFSEDFSSDRVRRYKVRGTIERKTK